MPLPTEPVPPHRLHLWQIQAVRDVLLVAAVIAIIWLGYIMSAVTVPLLVALLLAYLFEPLVQAMTRRMDWKRIEAVSALLIAFGGAVVIALILLIPLVVGQTVTLVNSVNDGSARRRVEQMAAYVPERIRDEISGLWEILPEGGAADRDEDESIEDDDVASDGVQGEAGDDDDAAIEGPIDDAPPDLPAGPLSEEDVRRIAREEIAQEQQEVAAATEDGDRSLFNLSERPLRTIGAIISGSIYVLLLLFLIPFYFFFFSLWYPHVVRFGRRLIPEKHRKRVLDLAGQMDKVIAGFVRGRLVICAITAVLLAAGWFLMGVPYGIMFGLLVGAMFLVPYLSGLGAVVAVAVSFFFRLGDGAGGFELWVWGLIAPAAWFMIVQFVESYILTPKIAGKATNLDPVTIVVVVLAGGSLLGVYGMLLAIPIAACGKILLTEVLFPRIDAWLKGERPDPLPIERE